MEFRCYNCGARLGAIPTLDALSVSQVMAVGADDVEGALKRLTLVGTPFEGMSAGSFCEFCLMAIRDIPKAFDTKHLYPYESFKKLVPPHVDTGAWINRRMVVAAAVTQYDPMVVAPFFLPRTLKMGIELVQYTCQYPGCGEALCWDYQGKEHILCMKHWRVDMRWYLKRDIVVARYLNTFTSHDPEVCMGAYVYSEVKGHYVPTCWSCDVIHGDMVDEAYEASLDRYWE